MKLFDVTHFLIFCYRKVTELMGIPRNGSLKMAGNSVVCKGPLLKMLTGFGFQPEEKSVNLFYKYLRNFPKLFLSQNVDKKGNAIRIGISIAYPHCVNIWGFEMSDDKNTFVITSRQRAREPEPN
jgi:hypothetical protein